jgi:hypothetical protein
MFVYNTIAVTQCAFSAVALLCHRPRFARTATSSSSLRVLVTTHNGYMMKVERQFDDQLGVANSGNVDDTSSSPATVRNNMGSEQVGEKGASATMDNNMSTSTGSATPLPEAPTPKPAADLCIADTLSLPREILFIGMIYTAYLLSRACHPVFSLLAALPLFVSTC